MLNVSSISVSLPKKKAVSENSMDALPKKKAVSFEGITMMALPKKKAVDFSADVFELQKKK